MPVEDLAAPAVSHDVDTVPQGEREGDRLSVREVARDRHRKGIGEHADEHCLDRNREPADRGGRPEERETPNRSRGSVNYNQECRQQEEPEVVADPRPKSSFTVPPTIPAL